MKMQTADQSKTISPGTRALKCPHALLRVALGLLAAWICGQAVAATTVELAWDPVADARVAAYEVHYGASSGQYTDHVEAITPSASLPAPAAGRVLYYAVRACDATRTLCSDFSNEVSRAAIAPPSAGFHVSQDSGYAPLTVLFTDDSSGDITSREWVLGDGTVVQDGAQVAHTYTEPGVYSVRLTVEGPGGSDVYERVDYVHVLEPLPGTGVGDSGSGSGSGADSGSGDSSSDNQPAEDPLVADNPVLEFGEVAVDHRWQWVGLERSFEDPVVVVTAPSGIGGDGTIVRVAEVSPEGFYLRLQEWGYLDGWHVAERVGYLVLERGRHQLSNGAWVEAGTLDTDATQRFESVVFEAPFETAPVVLAGVITVNGVEAVTTRLHAVDEFGFKVLLQEQENNALGHMTETLSYVAWEPSAGMVDGYRFEVGRTPRVVDHRPQGLVLDSAFASEPMFLANIQTFYGYDTAGLRWRGSQEAGLEVWVAEDRSADNEVLHAPEVVGYLVVEDTHSSTGD